MVFSSCLTSTVVVVMSALAAADYHYKATPGFGGMNAMRMRMQPPQPPPMPPRPSASNASNGIFFFAEDFGAIGDNKTDNTAAVTKGLNAVYSQGGGVLYMKSGVFRFAGSLVIPPGVTLAGTYTVVPSHDLRNGQNISDGTVLVPLGGRGTPCDINCTSAFITVVENGCLRGLVILYDEQERIHTPVPYPWAVYLGDPQGLYNKGKSADNAAVMDVELLGAWNGIAAIAAHRHYIARIQGQPINIGIFLDETYDIGRIEDVHWNPWFSSSKPFIYYQTTFGRGFVMGRSDWEYCFNTFAFAYAIGYHFIQRATGSMNGNFLGIGADSMLNASVQVDQSQPYGILITNGEFTAFCDAPQYTFCEAPGANWSPVHVKVSPQNQGGVKFTTSSFWGPAAGIAKVEGSGVVSFSQCRFDDWDEHINEKNQRFSNGTAAIEQIGDSALIVTQSEFARGASKTVHVAVDPAGKGKVIFSQNILKGTLNIKNGDRPKVIISDNLDDN